MGYRWVMSDYDLRLAARKQLDGAWGEMVIAQFICALPIILRDLLIGRFIRPDVYFFVLIDLSYINGLSLFRDVSWRVLWCLLVGPLFAGLAGLYLKRIRDQQISAGNVFDGFKDYGRSFLLSFLGIIFITLWSLLLVIPGIVKFYSYSMSFFIMRDNPGMRPLLAITKSRQMMDGFKAKLFMLHVSFIDWFLLCALPALIGSMIIIAAGDSFYSSSMTTIG